MATLRRRRNRAGTPSTTKPEVKSKSSTSIALPTEANVPPSKLTDYSICLYGEKGVGKSSLAAEFPDVLAVFNWEPGRRSLRIPQIPDSSKNEEPLNWHRFKRYVNLIIDQKKPGRIVIDTIDKMSQAAELHHARNISPDLDSLANLNDHGRGWSNMKFDVENTFYRLIQHDIRITFISHVRIRPMVLRSISREQLKTEDLPEQVQPACSGVGWDLLKVLCDMAFFFGYSGYDRTLHIRGSEAVWSSAPFLDHFMQPDGKGIDRSGEPLHILDMGVDPQSAYHNLCLAWDNKLVGQFYK